jgi:hypothetical protein
MIEAQSMEIFWWEIVIMKLYQHTLKMKL